MNDKKLSSRFLYLIGFVVMFVGLLISVWITYFIGIPIFFGGIILYVVGLTRRNGWNL